MNNSPLEFLAKKYGNIVKYDSAGNVSGIFVKFPKMKSSDLVAGLPNHTHPAFIINGVEQDYILQGDCRSRRTVQCISMPFPDVFRRFVKKNGLQAPVLAALRSSQSKTALSCVSSNLRANRTSSCRIAASS